MCLMGGPAGYGIFAQDGTAWSGGGTQANGATVYTVEIARGGSLHAGGDSRIGGVSGLTYSAQGRGRRGRARGQRAASVGPEPVGRRAEPVREAATVRITSDRSADVRVEMIDALGRTVAVAFDGTLAGGQPPRSG